MPYHKRVVTYQEADVDRASLVSIKDAADALGITMQGVIAAINRGELTEIVRDGARHPYRHRRYLLREEVEAARARREEADDAG